MGKIRIKTLGTADEAAQKEKAKIRREEKKKRLAKVPGLRGGERVVDMSATMETTEKKEITEPTAPSEIPAPSASQEKPPKPPRQRSKQYLAAKKIIEPGEFYPVDKAIELLKKTTLAHFDGSVEIHINTTEKGLRGQVNLPHGTGREVKVAIADETLLAEVEKGKINFDILVSSPEMMPKLAKVAKILGPRGLMPNPKSGTISDNPEKLATSLSKGQVQFKTETEAPIIHMVLGKVSFPPKHLEENFNALMAAIGPQKIKSIFLKSTMSPSIKVVTDLDKK